MTSKSTPCRRERKIVSYRPSLSLSRLFRTMKPRESRPFLRYYPVSCGNDRANSTDRLRHNIYRAVVKTIEKSFTRNSIPLVIFPRKKMSRALKRVLKKKKWEKTNVSCQGRQFIRLLRGKYNNNNNQIESSADSTACDVAVVLCDGPAKDSKGASACRRRI